VTKLSCITFNGWYIESEEAHTWRAWPFSVLDWPTVILRRNRSLVSTTVGNRKTQF